MVSTSTIDISTCFTIGWLIEVVWQPSTGTVLTEFRSYPSWGNPVSRRQLRSSTTPPYSAKSTPCRASQKTSYLVNCVPTELVVSKSWWTHPRSKNSKLSRAIPICSIRCPSTLNKNSVRMEEQHPSITIHQLQVSWPQWETPGPPTQPCSLHILQVFKLLFI